MSNRGKLPEVAFDNTSNLTLNTRRGTYARNETNPELRATIIDNVWPKLKRTQSIESGCSQALTSEKQAYRRRSSSSGENRSRSQSSDRSVSSRLEKREASAPDHTVSLENLAESFSELKMAQVNIEAGKNTERDELGQYQQYALNTERNAMRDQIRRLEEELDDKNKSMRRQADDYEFQLRQKEHQRTLQDNVFNAPKRMATVVSDSIIAPKPFTGKTTEGDAEGWLEYFVRYCDHRHLDADSQLTLFKLLMRDSAADWLSGQPGRQSGEGDSDELQRLTETISENYFRPGELRWRETGRLWGEIQKSDESVEDYMIRVRRCAKRLKMEGDALYDAVLHGLRPAIRMMVLSQKPDSVDALVRAARVAEAAAPVSQDNLSSLVVKLMETAAQAQERQTTELKALNSRVAALSVAQSDAQQTTINAADAPAGGARPPQYIGPQRRQFRPTAQTRQRDNYVRNFSGRQDGGGPRSFRQPYEQQQQQQQRPQQMNPPAGQGGECGYCALRHERGNCRAVGAECRRCGRIGHFARACRSSNARQQ
jgi:Zinc knuckle